MHTSTLLTAFLLPGALVAYWLVCDWRKERQLRRKWTTEPLLSDGIKRPRNVRVRRAAVADE